MDTLDHPSWDLGYRTGLADASPVPALAHHYQDLSDWLDGLADDADHHARACRGMKRADWEGGARAFRYAAEHIRQDIPWLEG